MIIIIINTIIINIMIIIIIIIIILLSIVKVVLVVANIVLLLWSLCILCFYVRPIYISFYSTLCIYSYKLLNFPCRDTGFFSCFVVRFDKSKYD